MNETEAQTPTSTVELNVPDLTHMVKVYTGLQEQNVVDLVVPKVPDAPVTVSIIARKDPSITDSPILRGKITLRENVTGLQAEDRQARVDEAFSQLRAGGFEVDIRYKPEATSAGFQQTLVNIHAQDFSCECSIGLGPTGKVTILMESPLSKLVKSSTKKVKAFYDVAQTLVQTMDAREKEHVYVATADFRQEPPLTLTERAIAPDQSFNDLLEVGRAFRTKAYIHFSDDQLKTMRNVLHEEIERHRVIDYIPLRLKQIEFLTTYTDIEIERLKNNQDQVSDDIRQKKIEYYTQLQYAAFILKECSLSELKGLDMIVALEQHYRSIDQSSILNMDALISSSYVGILDNNYLSQVTEGVQNFFRLSTRIDYIRNAPSDSLDTEFIEGAMKNLEDYTTKNKQGDTVYEFRSKAFDAFEVWVAHRILADGEGAFGKHSQQIHEAIRSLALRNKVINTISFLGGMIQESTIQFRLFTKPNPEE